MTAFIFLHLLLIVVAIAIVIIITTATIITIIVRIVATQSAGLARWRDLPQAAGFKSRMRLLGTLRCTSGHLGLSLLRLQRSTRGSSCADPKDFERAQATPQVHLMREFEHQFGHLASRVAPHNARGAAVFAPSRGHLGEGQLSGPRPDA